MYILTKVDEKPNQNGAVLSLCLNKLGDIKRHPAPDGTTYIVYRSEADYHKGKVHGFYTVRDGRLVRDL